MSTPQFKLCSTDLFSGEQLEVPHFKKDCTELQLLRVCNTLNSGNNARVYKTVYFVKEVHESDAKESAK